MISRPVRTPNGEEYNARCFVSGSYRRKFIEYQLAITPRTPRFKATDQTRDFLKRMWDRAKDRSRHASCIITFPRCTSKTTPGRWGCIPSRMKLAAEPHYPSVVADGRIR